MKDRLSSFMKSEALSPGKLAEILGIQPSSISHLVSGRNKPSFDFIYKILQQFPRLSPDWFITGTGGMYRGDDINESSEGLHKGELQPANDSVGVEASSDFEFELNDELLSSASNVTPPKSTNPVNTTIRSSVSRDAKDVSLLSEIVADSRIGTKSIERIVIFFNNNTFKEYISE